MECRSVNAVNNFCSQIEKNNNRAKQREGKRISVCVCVCANLSISQHCQINEFLLIFLPCSAFMILFGLMWVSFAFFLVFLSFSLPSRSPSHFTICHNTNSQLIISCNCVVYNDFWTHVHTSTEIQCIRRLETVLVIHRHWIYKKKAILSCYSRSPACIKMRQKFKTFERKFGRETHHSFLISSLFSLGCLSFSPQYRLIVGCNFSVYLQLKRAYFYANTDFVNFVSRYKKQWEQL